MASIPPFRCDSSKRDEGTRADGTADTRTRLRTDNARILSSDRGRVAAQRDYALRENNVPKLGASSKLSDWKDWLGDLESNQDSEILNL
jgi:hypothetical protein